MEIEKLEKNNISLNNEIVNEITQKNFLETNLGKAINTAVDIGIRAILPDFFEEQVIEIKDNLLNYGLKDGIKQSIDDAIDLGKSALGIVTGNFESISQMQNAVKSGGIIDGISSLSIVMKNSKITGTINTSKKAKSLSISLDSKSTITLTGNSYYTSLTNEVSSGENIVKGEYTFSEYSSEGGDDVKPVSKGSFIGLSMLLVLFALF